MDYVVRVLRAGEATLSLRWVIPFIRLTGADPEQMQLLVQEGISLADFTNSDTRVRHSIVMELLRRAVARENEPTLGLRAGLEVSPGDLDTLEYAARSCANLREALHCVNRYMHLMHGAQRARLIEEGDLATWEVRIVDDVPQPPAANDFALAAACTFSHRYTGVRNVLREVHFQHAVSTSLTEYARVFDGAEIKLGMPHNALVFARGHLDAPMSHAHPGLQRAYEQHANAMLQRLTHREGVSVRVRQHLVAQLRAGDVGVRTVAGKLGMSVPTLRRRLGEEGLTYSKLLDDVRLELAKNYLEDASLAVSDVAFLLGFSHVTAFHKAFRRWSGGSTPVEYRIAVRAQATPRRRRA